MSQENVAVIRRAIESLNDWSLPPECFDTEVEYTTQPDAPNYTTYHGLSGLERSQRSVREAWKSIRAEPREFIEGDGVVVALIHFELRANSGIELQQDQGWVYWMRDGRIRRMEQYATKREALEASGLREL
jgi:ketosteroid isomerase-like protein